MRIKFYSPLQGKIELNQSYMPRDKEYDEYYDDYIEELDAEELTKYREKINKAIEDFPKNFANSYTDRGLMEFFCHEDKNMELEINKKVFSANPSIVNIDGTLYGVMEIETISELDKDELDALKNYFTGQYSDGWGEGFEQQEIEIDKGSLYISFWNSDNFFIETADEMLKRIMYEKEESIGMQMEW